MDITFHNAPLAEIIVELRWPPGSSTLSLPRQPSVQQFPPLVLGSGQFENFIHRFGGEVYNRGFERTERIIPGGLPVPAGQVVCRFKSSSPERANVLYQVGLGIFSANAVPPYRSWNNFVPVVEKGVEALINARDDAEKTLPFNTVSLRYIDSFGPQLTGGRDAATFLSEVLKIELIFPEAILKHRAPDKSLKPFLVTTVPLTSGVLRLGAGDALVNGKPTILLDTALSTNNVVEPNKDRVMESLNLAHTLIREIFLDLTLPIHDLMQPEQ
jgi:uncharacterized protein (TIGR04255 family)